MATGTIEGAVASAMRLDLWGTRFSSVSGPLFLSCRGYRRHGILVPFTGPIRGRILRGRERRLSRAAALPGPRAAAPPAGGRRRVRRQRVPPPERSGREGKEHRALPGGDGGARPGGGAGERLDRHRDLHPDRRPGPPPPRARRHREEGLPLEDRLLGREGVRLALRPAAAGDEPGRPLLGRRQARVDPLGVVEVPARLPAGLAARIALLGFAERLPRGRLVAAELEG